MKRVWVTAAVVLLWAGSVSAATKYWDIDGATAGAGGATPAGTWDTTTANWTTDSSGSSAGTTWTAGDAAVFAAGTNATGSYTVTLGASTTQDTSGITLEEGNVTVTGGTALNLSGASAFNIVSGSLLTLSSKVTGAGPTTVQGGGSLLLGSTASTNTGAISVTGGSTLRVISSAAIGGTGVGAGNITLDNGTFQNDVATGAPTFLTGNRGFIIGAGGGTINVNGTAIQIYTSGSITGAGNTVTKTGTGTFRFTTPTASTFSKLVVTGGLWQGAADTIFGAVPGSFTADAITLNGGGISSNAGYSLSANRGITINSGGGTINTSSSLNVLGVITGSGVLTKTGANTLTLSAGNNYSNNTLVTAGKLAVANASALGTTAGDTQVSSGAELLFDGSANSFTIAEPIQIAGIGAGDGGAITVQNNSVTVFTGPVTLSADAQITTSGTGTATYSNASAITGTDKNLTIQGGSGAGGGSTVSGAISLGTGSLTKLQGGTWTLSNPTGNSYSGGTTIGGGTLAVTNTSGSGTGSGNITIGSGATTGTLNVGTGGAGGSVSGNITFANTSNTSLVNFNRTTDSTYAGTISGSNGNVTKAGAGALTFTSANSYTGTTTINGGTLKANNTTGSATGSGAVIVNSGGTLAGTGAVSGPVTVNSGGTLAPGGSIESLAVGALTFNAGSTFAYEIDGNQSLAVAADLVNANGDLTIAATGALLSFAAVLPPAAKLTLISYAGNWNGGAFDTYADDTVITVGSAQYVINYNDTTGGGNFGGGAYSKYVTLTAVPEASSVLFGSLVCLLLGLFYGVPGWRKGRVAE